MFGESIITILFRLLNFAALMGLFAFIFKKYMQEGIEKSIEQERLDEIHVNNHIIEVDHRSSQLSQELVDQEKLCRQLLERTNQWRSAFNEDMHKKQREQQVLQLQVLDRAKRQAKTITHERMAQAVLPKAIEEARMHLIETFAHAEKNKAFVLDIVHHIKKSA